MYCSLIPSAKIMNIIKYGFITVSEGKRHLPTSLRSVGNLLYPPHGREYEDCKQTLKLSLNPTHK